MLKKPIRLIDHSRHPPPFLSIPYYLPDLENENEIEDNKLKRETHNE